MEGCQSLIYNYYSVGWLVGASSFAIAIIEKRRLAAACLIESSPGVLEVQSKTHAAAAQGMDPKLLLA